jgi:twinkle protein
MNWSELGIDLKGRTNGSFKTKCPKCSDSRKNKRDTSLSVYMDDGVYKCHHCDWKGSVNDDDNEMSEKKEKEYVRPEFNNRTELPDNVIQWFMKRGLKQETVKHFNVAYGRVWMPGGEGGEADTIQYPYYRHGKPINIKFKTPNKRFKMSKDAEKTLYNIDAIKDSDEILFCEGEEEVLSWHQAGYKYATSVPNGASKGTNNLDYLGPIWDEFLANKKKVYIATDNDEPGKKLAEDLISRFGKDICYVIEYKNKDANDDLKYEGEEHLMKLLKNAKGFPVEGIFLADDREETLWKMYNDKDFFPRGTTTYVTALDPHFTWRKGDYTTFYGPGNQGKTTFLLMLCVLKSMHEGDVWAIFTPEQNPPDEFYIDIIHMYIGQSADPNFATMQMNKAQFKKGIEFIKKHFIYVYPEQYHDKDTLFGIFKNVIIRHNVTGIIIDPINQVERLDTDAKIRDDQYISRFASQFKRFILNHNVYGVVVTHGKIRYDEKSGIAHIPNMYRDIEGGEMTARKTDNILAYWRPNFQNDITDSYCIVFPQKLKKQKLTGIPGQVEFTYEKKTNRYYDIEGRCSFENRVHKDKQKLIPLVDAVTNIGEPEADNFFGPNSDDGMPDEVPF